MRFIVLMTTVFCFVLNGSATGFTLWNDLRASALLPGDAVTLRVENPQAAGSTNTVLYADNGIQEMALGSVTDGPSTLEATLPGPVSGRRSYGFRYVRNDSLDLLAVRLPDGADPTPGDLTLLSNDPTGDEVYGLPHLDLTECRISRDDTRLFAALTNAGGGFPVNSGLTFFSYFLGIKDPTVADPDTVFAMIHTVSAAGIIEPGLYRVFGTGVNDLLKIGEITATEVPGENRLLLSCQLADLLADPVFQSWYDTADPRLDVAGFTQRISLIGGVGEADSTPGGLWHLRDVGLDPGPNQLPQLTDLVLPEQPAGGFVSVVYHDLDGHCPVLAEIVFDGTETFALRPQTLDYGAPVEYRSETDLPPLVSGTWNQLVARFSDNQTEVVELVENSVSAVLGSSWLKALAAPNPFSAQTRLTFELPSSQRVKLNIYDLKGRRIRTLVNADLPAGPHASSWDGRDDGGRPQPAGIYFYHLRGSGVEVVKRIALVR